MAERHRTDRAVCAAKVRYEDLHAAWRAINRQRNRRGKPRHRVYECPVCRGYHLATAPRFRGRSRG